jgi:hypothetical protein
MKPRTDETPRVEVQTEEERPGGWSYLVLVHRARGADEYTVTLSWRDHDYWCGGALAPSRVMQAVMEYLLKHECPALPSRFDAARARRLLPRIDQEIRSML